MGCNTSNKRSSKHFIKTLKASIHFSNFANSKMLPHGTALLESVELVMEDITWKSFNDSLSLSASCREQCFLLLRFSHKRIFR